MFRSHRHSAETAAHNARHVARLVSDILADYGYNLPATVRTGVTRAALRFDRVQFHTVAALAEGHPDPVARQFLAIALGTLMDAASALRHPDPGHRAIAGYALRMDQLRDMVTAYQAGKPVLPFDRVRPYVIR
ncbi:hypothetical protein Ppa06_57910 [Planomonospora parontospora subsp. parontospora]|uniref:Uncharacterized protein n=2 Tax=Planomonospora parontospora TaxID=58119 RepID=A0AA37BM04_9ACTN|nr:hypothetical protein [Planomonospora parontospora]GGK90452.1 hypothetical protein GCM10010126_57400 [Planomonospora parontospora]GII11993.1 hypothetical protein Ppa06_57910 [Planomonospora parontospora subsp. parontospora]